MAPRRLPSRSAVKEIWGMIDNKITAYRRGGKRGFDLLVLLAVLPFVLPMAVILSLIVRLGLGSPVFFCQMRPGYQGGPFALVKFRTMTFDRDANGSLLSDDKRLTNLGKALRRYSLDEIPQF